MIHPLVKGSIESLHPSFETLLSSAPIIELRGVPKRRAYLFSENHTHLYVGRSNNIPDRYRAHCGAGAKENKAAFAMLLARKETGIYAKYLMGTSRKTLMTNELFKAAFDKAKQRIARMAFRVVDEPDQIKQAFLEIYVAVALETKHNSFATH